MKLTVRTPCNVDWNGMRGCDRQRHCASCVKQVHNLSELTQAEAKVVLAQPNVCARFRVGADGNARFKSAAAVVLSAMLVSSPALASGTIAEVPVGQNWLVELVESFTQPEEREHVLMGDVAEVVEPAFELRTLTNATVQDLTLVCDEQVVVVPAGTVGRFESPAGTSCSTATSFGKAAWTERDVTCARVGRTLSCVVEAR